MINNEWHIIGMCVSDFELLSSKRFSCHTLRIEVEKYAGDTFEAEVRIFSTNKVIDTKRKMLGKMVAVNGFIDTIKNDDGSVKINLVAQNILEISKKTMDTKVKMEDKPLNDIDDLPF